MLQGVRVKPIVCLAVLLVLAAPAAASGYSSGGYTTEPESQGGIEVGNRTANEAAEQRARENTEREEREAKAAEEKKAGEERQQREETEHAKAQHEGEAGQAGEAGTTQCVVPALKGDTLTQARRALRAAHCKLGHVTWPPRGHGRHVVRRQGLRVGSKHPAGTAVAVTLAPVRLGR